MVKLGLLRCVTPLIVVVVATAAVHADEIQNAVHSNQDDTVKTFVVKRIGATTLTPQPMAQPVANAAGRAAVTDTPALYPQLGAGAYPSPVQHVPSQMGGSAITNQAFAPHEMLYPHEYRALYPPYYYRVRGGWLVTPFGVSSHDHWELLGTEVRVKYKSRISLSSRFVPPILR